MHNANSERLSERLSTQSIRVLNRMYLERNIQYIYILRQKNKYIYMDMQVKNMLLLIFNVRKSLTRAA